MLWFVLACATKVVPVPQLQMGSPAPKTKPPAGENAPSTFGNLGCGLTVGFQKVDERFVDAVRTPEGEVLIATEAIKGSFEATLLFSLEEDGVAWHSILGAGSDEDTPATLSQVEGGYLVAGSTWSHGAGMSDGWLAMVDPAGAVKWQRTYGLYDRDVGLGFAPIGAGGLFVTAVPDYGLVVQQLDALGGETGRMGFAGGYRSMALQALPDGALLYGAVEKGESAAGHLLRLGSDGSAVWRLELGQDSAVSFAMANGDGYVAALSGAAPSLAFVSSQGVLSETVLLPPELQGLRVVGGLRTELGPLFVGQAEDGSRAVQMNDDGDVVWSQTLAKIAIQDALSVDDKVLFMGNAQGASSQDFFGIYLDAASGGTVCQPEPEPEPELDTGLDAESGEDSTEGKGTEAVGPSQAE